MKESLYSQDFIATLKSKNDIVSVIGKYVRLDKKGRNFWACCPFHHEKTPSFCVNEYEQFYHCFGCGESGDVITFLRKYENLTYMEAIKYLADNVGMELPTFENNEKYIQQKKQKDTSLKILNLAKEIYKKNIYLSTAKLAQEYIKKRKVTKKELEKFELGYSVDAFQIVNELKKLNFTKEELKISGVCEIGKSGKPYDFLSERLIFPIVNSHGDCIGFSGRDLKNSKIMKYKNTSTTLVFDKSKTIYGINLIKKLKQTQPLSYIIMVEGQFDVITMHRYGFENTIACLGTAVTKEHLRELKRFTDKVILCLDGDFAGQKATLRTLETFNNSDIEVKVAILPNGQDPDEFLSKNGNKKMQELLQNAVTPMDFKIYIAKNKYNLEKNSGKTSFVKEVLKEINKLPSNSEKEIYLKEINQITNISIDILRRDLIQSPVIPPKIQQKKWELPNEQNSTIKATNFIIASLLFNKKYSNLKIDLNKFLTDPSLKKLYNLIQDNKQKGQKIIVSTLFDIFDVDNEHNIKEIINFNFEEVGNEKSYFYSCLWQLIENYLKFRKSDLSKQYTKEIDLKNKKNLLNEIAKIDIQLKNKNLGEFINE